MDLLNQSGDRGHTGPSPAVSVGHLQLAQAAHVTAWQYFEASSESQIAKASRVKSFDICAQSSEAVFESCESSGELAREMACV